MSYVWVFRFVLSRCLTGNEEEAFGQLDNKSEEVLNHFYASEDVEQVETIGRSKNLIHLQPPSAQKQ